jgi:Tol biopolymer transport system component
MSLAAGSRIGCYEVLGILGAGGMGEVYRARDTKLGRDVALKVLPELFAADADRLARFQREAQLLASLNHPNIGGIHGLEDGASTGSGQAALRALVLELVEGETLADRIRRGPLTVDEAVGVARQIADALEAAHERGVIHRDLKPANVKITPDGKVKVLDFGLAKAMDTAPSSPHMSHSPTLSLAGTVAGMVLGTAAYMSPEQAKGLPADQRSDVFSFGCVLYEMLTGRQVFQADTAAESLAAVLMRTPDLDALPPALPPRLRALVQRCLDKDPKRRWHAVADLRFELEGIAVDPNAATLVAPAAAPMVTTTSAWRRALPALLAAVVAGASASLVTWWSVDRPRPLGVTRFSFAVDDVPLSVRRMGFSVLAVSPDGGKIVYAANGRLYIRSMSDMESRPIAGTNVDAIAPFFSPDGQWIAFFSLQDSTLKKVASTGGAPFTLCKTNDSVGGGSWDGNAIAFVQSGKGVVRVSADGGEPEVIAAVAADELVYGPQLAEGGRTVLFTLTTGSGVDRWDKAQTVVQTAGSADRTVVLHGGSAARYVPTGHLVYALGGTVLAVPFDLAKRKMRGGPVPVVEGVARAPNPAVQTGVAHFAISPNGTLVYLPGTAPAAAAPKTLAWVDRSGKVERLSLPPQPFVHPRLSPNGALIAVGADDGKDANVWIYDLQTHASPRRLTFGGRNLFPIWSRDSRFVAFQSDREGDLAVFRQPADGSGVPERVTKPEPGTQHEPESWSPDGKTLSLDVWHGVNQGVWKQSFEGDRKLEMLVDDPDVTEKHSVFSPDGRWVAYMATRTQSSVGGGGGGVFMEPYPQTGAKYQVASGGARTPVWSPDGRQLFYHDVNANRVVVVDVRTQPGVTIGTPVAIPLDGTVHPIAQRNYDVTPDGKQLIVVLPVSASGTAAERQVAPQINVVLNWSEELKTRVPIK